MKQIDIDVLIVIEHKVRELESACLLKYEFEKRGYSTIIEGIYPNKELLPIKYKAKIIIIPWAYNDRDMKYISCFYKNSPNAIIINLHHEQYSGQDEKNICLPHGNARNLYHIAWGKIFEDGLIRVGCNKTKIYKVGNIKLDFFKQNLKEVFYCKEQLAKMFDIELNKRWILFIANGYHLMNSKKIEEIAKLDKDIEIKRNTSIKCRMDFLKYVDNYLEKNQNVIFIYRPHPVYSDLDNNDIMVKKLVIKYPKNFFVISKLTIGNWLINVDGCISFHSTSAIECCMSKIPYYLFRTEKLPSDLDYPFFKDYKYIIDSEKAFGNVINGAEYDNRVLEKHLSNYYVISEKYSYKEIVDNAIKLSSKTEMKVKYSYWFINKLKSYMKVFLKKCSKLNLIKKILLCFNDNRIYRIINKTDDYFDNNDIKSYIEKIEKCL